MEPRGGDLVAVVSSHDRLVQQQVATQKVERSESSTVGVSESAIDSMCECSQTTQKNNFFVLFRFKFDKKEERQEVGLSNGEKTKETSFRSTKMRCLLSGEATPSFLSVLWGKCPCVCRTCGGSQIKGAGYCHYC